MQPFMVPALCLSDDLWAKILSLYATDATHHQHGLQHMNNDVQSQKLYYRYQELRLVCKRFNKLLDQSEDSNTLLLWEEMDGRKLPSLIRWIQSRSSTLRDFVAHCPSCTQDAALTAAMPAPCNSASSLETIFLRAPSDVALSLLSEFPNLTKFVLDADNDSNLDLGSLKFIPKLSELHLKDGSFSDVGELPHLTSLHMYRARAFFGQCHFHLSLRELVLWESQLGAMPSNGVAACLSLQFLACCHSRICAGREADCIDTLSDDAESLLPTNIAALTQLTHLSLESNVPRESIVSVGGLYSLTSLRTLRLVDVASSLRLMV